LKGFIQSYIPAFAALLGLVLLGGCQKKTSLEGLDSPSSETVEETSEYAPVVSVILPMGRGLCTGTIVSPRAVLTAAHCTLDEGNYAVVTSAGTFRTYTREVLGSGDVDDTHDLAFLIFNSDIASRRLGQVYPIGTDGVSTLERVRLVGFGCNNFEKKSGSGKKRTGTNQVVEVGDYIEILTPYSTTTAGTRGILGPENRAGSCFGDSGGPMLQPNGTESFKVVGVSHAGGKMSDNLLSQYVNLREQTNMDFIHEIDNRYNLEVFKDCLVSADSDCSAQSASMQIVSFLKWAWTKLTLWFF